MSRLLSASPIWRRSADKALSCFVYRRGENKLQHLLVVLFAAVQQSLSTAMVWGLFVFIVVFFFKLLLSLSFVRKEFLRSVCRVRKKRNCKIVPKLFFFIAVITIKKRTKCTLQINHQPDATVFPVYYPDVYLQLNMFRAFSRPSSGAQWLQWQPVVSPCIIVQFK